MLIPEANRHQLSPNQLLDNKRPFIMRIEELLNHLSLDLAGFSLDHIALRINDEKQASQLEKEWEQLGSVISKANINGRPIFIFKLSQAIPLSIWSTDCVEFPYPKQGKLYPTDGWEHVEFVVPSEAKNADDYLTDIYRQFPLLPQKINEMKTQGLEVKLSMPRGEKERLANPTVAFKWNNVCVKLHPHSIEEVIASELD